MENILIFLAAAGAIGAAGYFIFKDDTNDKNAVDTPDFIPPVSDKKPNQLSPAQQSVIDLLTDPYKGVTLSPWLMAFNSNEGAAYSQSRVMRAIRASMIEKEGYRQDVYLDTRNLLTVGIGHLVLPRDNLKLGDTVSKQRVDEFFGQDIRAALIAAENQARELSALTDDFVKALIHVNFQLGTGWKDEHRKTWRYLKEGNYQAAAVETKNSAWYNQTPVRANDFSNAILRLRDTKLYGA